MALRVGLESPLNEVGLLEATAAHAADASGGPSEDLGRSAFISAPFLYALNNQLRTGADKGNPTV